MGRHWTERLSCHACGTTFRTSIAEAKHRHNFPVMCKRNAAFKRFEAEIEQAKLDKMSEGMPGNEPETFEEFSKSCDRWI